MCDPAKTNYSSRDSHQARSKVCDTDRVNTGQYGVVGLPFVCCFDIAKAVLLVLHLLHLQ